MRFAVTDRSGAAGTPSERNGRGNFLRDSTIVKTHCVTRYLREPQPRGRLSVDFTSALYLGIRHSSWSLRPWLQLTTGKPAALETAPSAQVVAKALAQLQGCESAILLPWTLHLFFDLFEVLRPERIKIYADAAAYPIAHWGAERAAARGVLLQRLPHYDPRAARLAIEEDEGANLRPVIVADGFCPECGRPAPLGEYLQCVTGHGGYVVLDDTQALGIWGTGPGPRDPYGLGGGGSLRLHRLRSPHVILGSSLAKGFGVPVAVLSGSGRLIQSFRRRSQTQVHTSPLRSRCCVQPRTRCALTRDTATKCAFVWHSSS